MKKLAFPTDPTPRACRTCDHRAGPFYCAHHKTDVRDVKQTFQSGNCYARQIDGLLAPTDNKYGRVVPSAN
jgi:hypothetical protein